jgi:hypothetical protein
MTNLKRLTQWTQRVQIYISVQQYNHNSATKTRTEIKGHFNNI